MKKHKPVTIALMIIGGICAAVLLAFLLGFAVKALWNALMPDIFGLPEVSYWQAVGLLILGHLLFGGGRSFHKDRHHRKHRHLHAEKRESLDRPPEPDPQTV
jgi:membrane protein implicated in regulation of membrane protease activity